MKVYLAQIVEWKRNHDGDYIRDENDDLTSDDHVIGVFASLALSKAAINSLIPEIMWCDEDADLPGYAESQDNLDAEAFTFRDSHHKLHYADFVTVERYNLDEIREGFRLPLIATH